MLRQPTSDHDETELKRTLDETHAKGNNVTSYCMFEDMKTKAEETWEYDNPAFRFYLMYRTTQGEQSLVTCRVVDTISAYLPVYNNVNSEHWCSLRKNSG
jgi:sarcosine oxidase delta subunit